MKRKKVVLTNEFHETRITLYAQCVKSGLLRLSKNQVYRARHKLCWIADCTCGDALGARGKQELSFETEPQSNGSVLLEIIS